MSLEELVLGLVEQAFEMSAARQAFFLSDEDGKLATCAHIVRQGIDAAPARLLSKEQLGQLREGFGAKEISTLTLDGAIVIVCVPIRLHSRWMGTICLQVQSSQKVATRRLKELSEDAEQHLGTPRLLGEFRTVVQDLLSRRSRLPSVALSGIDRRRGESEKGPMAQRILEIRCGEASYPFRKAVEVVETPTSFTVAGLEDTVVGHGQTAERAQRDFSRQFHEAFQRLRSLLPSFRDQQQQALWSILVRLVDIEALDRNRTVVVPNELGKVLSKQGTARRLKWHSGKVQDLDLDALPATFATLDEGSWFKAVVEQRYLTGEVTGVLHATAIARPECHDLEARQRFWGQGA